MPSRIVQFGVFQAHLDSGELYRDGIRLKLGGQPFQVLAFLLSRPGEVVTREELQSALWQSDTFVDFDHGLNTAINKIREALGDSAANPRFVETVPRRGYRFIAPVDRPGQVEPEPPPPPPARPTAPRNWIPIAAGIAAVALLAAGTILLRSRPPAPVDYKLTQVTRDTGLTHQPSISADGNFVVYSSDRATGKDMDLWIQHVSGGQPVQLTSTPANEGHPTLSADGRKVAFGVGEGHNAPQEIYVAPALGGTPRLLAAAGHTPQISPDGVSVAYSTGHYMQQSELRVVSTEGGPSRTVSTGLKWAMGPFWTRDGNNLLFWTGCHERGKPCDYWMVPAAGGAGRNTGADGHLGKAGARSMRHMAVDADASPTASEGPAGLVLAARSGDGDDLWLTPLSGGIATSPAIRITLGAGAANPSVAAATGRIAFARRSVSPGLWMLPIEGSSGRVSGELRRVGRENATMNYPSVSADGKKLAYVSNRGGNPDVWVRDLDTGVDRQLTSSTVNEFRAVISPGGDRVAFGVNRNFYIIPSAGGQEKLVCSDCSANVVGWSPDGAKLLYYWGKPYRHATVDVATGQKRDVVWHPTADIHNGRISPDGRWITFKLVEEESSAVYVAPLAGEGGGKPDTWIRMPGEANAQSSFWSRDGNLLYIHQQGALWAHKLRQDTKMPIGDAFLVRRFDGRFSPIFSADGFTKDSLYFLMMETTANIWTADPVSR